MALSTKSWTDMVMKAHMQGYILKTQLKSLLSLLPEMEKAFDGTMVSVKTMYSKLMSAVADFQKSIPTDGSIAETVGNQILIEMVKTGSAVINKSMGLIQGAL